ncbi:GFA family protein [Halovulum dunhuangense]|uniref:GFA family protein n=1 Tax=Halovulum dunhuangense TaxID=1505036 RepID=A0A849L071_9RHOB|nr:GFA family protein [Halovulum dunhuangense]NNU79390.1 GFA family protein [Halovulum dunhuangense]
MSEKSGGCLCGAVRFTARDVPARFGVCHCPMCRRWTGSALLAVTLPERNVRWTGAEHMAERQTTSFGRRGWCRECGSGLWFKVTADSPYKGEIDLPIGLFDDPDGFNMASEIYIDHKPDSYDFAGAGRKQLTRAECVAIFPRLDGE